MGIPPSDPNVKPSPLDPSQFAGAKGLAILKRPQIAAPSSTALAVIPPGKGIKGERTVYAVSGGRVYDVAAGEQPPMVSGMAVYHVPLSRKEVMRAVFWGWDEAAKEVKDLADGATSPAAKAAAISGLMTMSNRAMVYDSDMDGHTRFAHDMGYRLGLRFEIIKYPDIMALLPHGGIQGSGRERKDVQGEIETHQAPMSY
jgi:hypothetical protein